MPIDFRFERDLRRNKFTILHTRSPIDFVREFNSLKAYYTIMIYASFEADYRGRSRSYLPKGDRLIIIKPDGTILIHEGRGREPVNWQPPGSRVIATYKDKELLIKSIRDKPREELIIRIKDYYFIAFAKLDTTGIQKDISEKAMVKMVLMNPNLIEDGFRPIKTEVQTPFGYIDLIGEDKEGSLVVLEFKRVTAQVNAVYQLMRYVDHMKSNTRRKVRGILVAPALSERSKIIIKRYGLEYKKLNPKEILA